MDPLDKHIRESVSRQSKSFLVEKKKSEDQKAYQEYFDSLLKKYKVSSPDELQGSTKQKFFNEVDAGWKSKKESSKKKV